mgnify:CR=1 FL=1
MAIEQVFKPLQTRGRTGRQPDKKMETETEKYLNSCKERIRGIDERSWKAARRHWNGIAKPLYGLGLLEDALVRIAGIQGTENLSLEKKAVAVMCADNGIIEEGVSQSGHEVTTVVTGNIARGLASVNRMAACAGADVYPVGCGNEGNNRSGKPSAQEDTKRHPQFFQGACHGGSRNAGGDPRGVWKLQRCSAGRDTILWRLGKWGSGTPPQAARWLPCFWNARRSRSPGRERPGPGRRTA